MHKRQEQAELVLVERSRIQLLERCDLAPYDLKTLLNAHPADIGIVFELVQQVYGLPELRSDVEIVMTVIITFIGDVSGAFRILVDNCDWDGCRLRFDSYRAV